MQISVERSQKLLLEALLESGSVQATAIPSLREKLERTEAEIERLERQRQEIELGSEVVGEANWSIESGSGYGRVEGAKEQNRRLSLITRAVDRFDLAQVFMQVGLVLGAISLLFKSPTRKWRFFYLMCLLGSVGMVFSAWGWAVALGV